MSLMIWLLLGLTIATPIVLSLILAIQDPGETYKYDSFVAGPWMFRWVLIVHMPSTLFLAAPGAMYNLFRYGWEGAWDFLRDECELQNVIPKFIAGHR